MTADPPPKCMELIPHGPGRYYWCALPADPRSAPRTPRCGQHLTDDTARPEPKETPT